MAGLLAVSIVVGLLKRGGPMPSALHLVGLVSGATIALQAAGIVLVYRATRVINFAQIQMGTLAGVLFVSLTEHRTLIRGVAAVCPACLPHRDTLGDVVRGAGGRTAELDALLRNQGLQQGLKTPLDDPTLLEYFPPGFSKRDFEIGTAPDWLVHLNYWVSMLLAITLAMLLVGAVYLVIRKFNRAPKLVLTVITVAAGFAVQHAGSWLLGKLFEETNDGDGFIVFRGTARLPFEGTFTWEPAVFTLADIVTVVVAVLAAGALLLYLSRSRVGIVLRGAAENPDRAETLGVNVGAVTARAWLIAGSLSGLAAILAVMRTGSAPAAGGYDVFLRTLTAAVAGGLVHLPLALLAGLVIGSTEQVFAFVFGSQSLLAAILLAIIVVLLLVQRGRSSRAERDADASWHASRELRAIPRELRSLPSVRMVLRVLAFVAALVVAGYPWFMSPSQTTTAVVTMVYAMVGLSLLVLTGWAGQISLGQMAFAALGAWVAVRLDWPLPFALLAGSIAGMLLAVVIGIPSLKLRGLHLAVTTLALGVAAPAVLFDRDLLGGDVAKELSRPLLLGIDFEDERAFYYLVLVLLALVVAATVGLRHSSVARTLIAAKDNEQAAMGFGINLLRARVVAFAVSGFMAAFGGVLLAYAQHGADPLAFAPETGVSAFLMTLVGGLGSIAGPIAGALYLGTLRILAGTAFAQFANLLLNPGVGLIVLLWVLPGGVIQGVYEIRDSWLRRVASRNRIAVPSLFVDRGEVDGVFAIQPKLRPSGGEMFVPQRFRLDGQWVVTARRAAKQKERVGG